MNDLLVILNPRQIEECIESFKALRIQKAWVTGYTEAQLTKIVPCLIRDTDFDRYILVSDDLIVGHDALSAVRRSREPVVTGYCNLSSDDWRVNITRSPLTRSNPQVASYDFYRYDEVISGPRTVRTWFTGMCLTQMSRELWLKFPFRVFMRENSNGYGSDYSLSKRLQDEDIPIVCPRASFCFHVKERWNQMDREPRKRLRIGEEQGVTFS